MNKLSWVHNSLELDLLLFKFKYWSNNKKIEFLLKKYKETFLLQLGLKHFLLGESKVNLFGKDIYYDTPLGLAIYQSMVGRFGVIFDYIDTKKVKTVVDVGANVGLFSLMVSDVLPKSRIYAIEPIPSTYKALEKNTRHNDKIKTHQQAIGSRSGYTQMYFNEQNSLGSHFLWGTEVFSKQEHQLRIKVNTLDKFCRTNSLKDIDLLKVDVETFETEVLKGAKKTLESTKYLLLEISVERNPNYTFSEINSLLFGNKYNFQLVWFRSFTGGQGAMKVGDFLFKNINQVK